jgi:hypothetical protein
VTDVIDTADNHVCSNTGLRLVRTPVHTVHRVARYQYGPMNPLQRTEYGGRDSWGRWDTAGGRTIYAGDNGRAAFVELLPYLRENLPKTPIATLFDDVDDVDATQSLADAVRAEIASSEMLNTVNQKWREDRRHYQLQLPTDRWLIDILSADSLAAINAKYKPRDGGFGEYTLSDLTGEDRNLTSEIAGWVRNANLDDGSRALGIRYLSKHGSDLPAYAIWLRSTDDGNPHAEPIEIVSTTLIPQNDPDLQAAARLHDLRVW